MIVIKFEKIENLRLKRSCIYTKENRVVTICHNSQHVKHEFGWSSFKIETIR